MKTWAESVWSGAAGETWVWPTDARVGPGALEVVDIDRVNKTVTIALREDPPMPSRFDYVKFDELAAAKQAAFKARFQELETMLNEQLPSSPGGRDPYGRAKALVLTALEEAYMWVGKAVRDEQVALRRAELEEGRGAA